MNDTTGDQINTSDEIELHELQAGGVENTDYYWDNNGEVPSFLDLDLDTPISNSSPKENQVVGRPFLYNARFNWPPNRLTSEAPVLQFSGVPKPIQSLFDISSDIDDVFSDNSIDSSNMPPKVDDVYKKLEKIYKPWKHEVAQIKVSKKVSNVQMEEFTSEYKEMRKLYKSLCRSVEGDMSEQAEANKILQDINEDFLFLEELSASRGSTSSNVSINVEPTPTADPDVTVIQSIKIIASKFDTLNRRIQPMKADILSTVGDSDIPEQSVALTRKISKIKADSEKIVEDSYELDSQISMEIVKLSTDEKQQVEH